MKQEEAAELQILNSQAQVLSEHIEKVDSGFMEIEYLKNSLDELKGSKKDSPIFAPVSNGIFVKAKLEESSKLLVNIGNGIIVEKTVDETKALLDERLTEMNGIRENLMGQMQKIEERLIKIGEK